MPFDPESYNQERFHAPFVFRKTVFIEPFNLFKSQRNSWFRLLKSKVTVITVIEKLMNPVSNVSSRQSSMHPLEEEKKNRGIASTKKLPKGAAGGRNVSPVVGANVFSASAGRDASVAKSNDRRALLCREPKQQVALKVGSSAIPVDGADTARVQSLMNRLSIIDRLLGKTGDKEQMMTPQAREMFGIQCKAIVQLDDDDKLADETLDPVFEYVEQSGNVLVASSLCECNALILMCREDYVNALNFFKKARELDGNNTISNFSGSMLIQHLMLGIVDASSKIQIDLFDPEGFYNEIKRWLPVGEAGNDCMEKLLEHEFNNDDEPASAVKIFHNAIKAIFAEEDILAAGKVRDFIDQLDKFQNSKPKTEIMKYAVYLLEFAMNLRLIEQGRFDEASKNIKLIEDCDVKHLGEYIRCEVLRKTGKIEKA